MGAHAPFPPGRTFADTRASEQIYRSGAGHILKFSNWYAPAPPLAPPSAPACLPMEDGIWTCRRLTWTVAGTSFVITKKVSPLTRPPIPERDEEDDVADDDDERTRRFLGP